MHNKKIKYDNMLFDSKIEASWYDFMQHSLLWDVLPQPKYLEDIKRWVPDFLMLAPSGNNILIDVKGVRTSEIWHNPIQHKHDVYREFLINSKERILNKSEWNKHDYKILIVGFKLRFDRDSLMLSEKKSILPFGLLYEPADNDVGYTSHPVYFIKHIEPMNNISFGFAELGCDQHNECVICGKEVSEENFITLREEKIISSIFNQTHRFFESNEYLDNDDFWSAIKK
jgi:hypothetical protein